MSKSAVEGVGNDVLLPLLVFAALTLLVMWLIRRSAAPQGPIVGRNAPVGLQEARRALNVHRERRARLTLALALARPSLHLRPADEEHACPICLDEVSFACGTNCGHTFCAHCLLAYWRSDQRGGALQCPMCRRNVTLLLEGFTPNEKLTERGQQLLGEIRTYNGAEAQPRSVRPSSSAVYSPNKALVV